MHLSSVRSVNINQEVMVFVIRLNGFCVCVFKKDICSFKRTCVERCEQSHNTGSNKPRYLGD